MHKGFQKVSKIFHIFGDMYGIEYLKEILKKNCSKEIKFNQSIKAIKEMGGILAELRRFDTCNI